MLSPVQTLGRTTMAIVSEFGRIGVFAGRVARTAASHPLRTGHLIQEIFEIGVGSLAIVCISGAAVGMVLGLQGYNTLSQFGAEESLGGIVGLTLVRELGPVLTALLVAGRAGSAIAAGIGSMVTTNQLSGLQMMSIDPIDFVVTPKALAMVIVMPLLSALCIVCGLASGYVYGVMALGIDGGNYIGGLESAIVFSDDVVGSLLKSLSFGLLIGLIATYQGYTSEPHAEGVSRATTSTVVRASVAVIICDFFITALWGV